MTLPIGIQLYTVRELCGADFAGTLQQLAEIGYRGVEFAGFHGLQPEQVKQLLDDLGLEACGSHAEMPTAENVNALVDGFAPVGIKRLVTGKGGDDFKDEDACKRTAEQFNAAAQLLAPHGMTIGYHNHWWEFPVVGDSNGLEVFLKYAEPAVFAELDVYWTAEAKLDPVEVIGRQKHRIPLYHIKDGNLQGGPPHTAVGAGKLDIAGIIGAVDESVAEWLIVELDDCETDMLEAVKASHAYLVGQGLAAGR